MTRGEGRIRVLVNAINDNAEPRGPDRYLMALLPRMTLCDAELSLTVLLAPWQQRLRSALTAAGVETALADPPRAPAARLLWQAGVFPRLARDVAPDVVFLPNLIWTPGLRIPSVITAHDLLHFRSPEKFGLMKARLLRLVIGLALRRSDRIIAVSDFTARDAVRFAGVPESRLAVVPNGGPAPEPRPAGAEDDGSFLFVGKLERSKGIVAMVRAFLDRETLFERGARLRIVGPEGNAAAEIRAAMGPQSRGIERLGYVDDATLEGLYRSCRAFVFPSVAEGFGLVVLEAMARGAPVIAARATSLPEVVGDAGLLVEPDDEVGLADAMERIASDDRLFGELQRRGYARLAQFSWDDAAARMAGILREVAR
ncbi:glycosyltransferase family 4 protein [Paracoccus ravus]|uniref:glycosyltransferase family 4 protein n=1 Tax=Paracoccus ravus TaxID=2447760 RepID=UPI00106E91E3|nr:glycosyltransferase family 1 protein [Paracoccus ravus]